MHLDDGIQINNTTISLLKNEYAKDKDRLFLNIQYLIVIFCAIFTNTVAQIKTGEMAIGGDSGDFGYSIIQTIDSEFIICGTTYSYAFNSNVGIYLLKLDSYGNLKWSKVVEGGNYLPTGAVSILQTDKNGFTISGDYNGGPFLLHIDSNGNKIWNTCFTAASVTQMIQIKDKGYAAVGDISSFINLGWRHNIYVIKLDTLGHAIWYKTIGDTDQQYGMSITNTYDKGFAIAGETYSFGAGNTDVYIIKLDSNGNLKWTKTIGGSNADGGYSIVQTYDKGLAVAGYTRSFGAGGSDVYVVKLDSLGNLKWTKTIGGIYDDGAYCIIQTNNKYLVIAGYTTSYGVNPFNASNLYVVKLDSAGNLIWTKTIGGARGEEGYSIIQTFDNGYAITGSTSSFSSKNGNVYFVKLDSMGNLCKAEISDSGKIGSGGIVGSGGTINSGGSASSGSFSIKDTGYLVTYICGIPANVNNVQDKKDEMIIEPNPTNGAIMLSIINQNIAKINYIEIYNIFGQLLYQTAEAQNTVNLNISNYPAGLYLIRVQSGNNSWCKKVMKE